MSRREAPLRIGLAALFRLLLARRGAQCRADVHLALFDRAQCSLELGDCRRFGDITGRAEPQRAPDEFLLLIHGEDHHPRFRLFFENARHRLEAVHDRHGDVHQRDVGMFLLDDGDGLAPVPRLVNLSDHRQSGQQRTQTGSNQDVIVCKQYSHHLRGGRDASPKPRTHPPLWDSRYRYLHCTE